jgi:hypothetical protein
MKNKPQPHSSDKEKLLRSSAAIWIGIDPGVNTGVAVWSRTEKRLTELRTFTAVGAEDYVRHLIEHADCDVMVVIEDARLRRTFQGGTERYQGAGSIKCDSRRWDEFCKHNGYSYALVPPSGASNKIAADVERFEGCTGYRCMNGKRIIVSGHARCAAMLVFGR